MYDAKPFKLHLHCPIRFSYQVLRHFTNVVMQSVECHGSAQGQGANPALDDTKTFPGFGKASLSGNTLYLFLRNKSIIFKSSTRIFWQ
ncbi:hypothetical protein TNIN_140361 [Trichonephila inaurata madagascariensis]|uniref:Uncharacterized protein n=1 Tax=Trichonephila inaurata madagascariensis TaxID=2747483 RepID=A0A8X7BUU9_9ARAC|nr:hypothetical protein TNIN_140361 [Trichonephila inaurata madagascariensis]